MHYHFSHSNDLKTILLMQVVNAVNMVHLQLNIVCANVCS